MVYYLVVALYIVICGLLIVTILLQQGKGGDIANAFGGGSSQAVFGARSGATLLTRATSVLAALFVIVAMVLTVWGSRGPSSVVGGVAAPQLPDAAKLPPASSAPASTAPASTAPASAAPAANPAPGNKTP